MPHRIETDGLTGGVDKPTLESGITLGSTELTETMTITNADADNPAVVLLSDSLGYLEFLSPDDGSDAGGDPTYAITPGDSRDVSFQRSGDVPTSGGPWTTVVTALLADGSTATVDVEIEARATIPQYIQTLTANLHAWDMRSTEVGGELSDNGGGTVTPIHGTMSGVALETPHPSNDALGGRIVFNAQADEVEMLAVPNVDTAAYGADKTWIVVFVSNGTTTNRRVWGWYGATDGEGPGFLYAAASSAWTLEDVWEATDQTLSTSYSHTDGGASEQMGASLQVRQVVAVTWVRDPDTPANSQKIVRWKAASHSRTGHSYLTRTVAEVSDPGAGTDAMALGHTGQSGSSPMDMEGGWMLVDHAITADEFNTILDLLGMGGTA